MSLKEKLQNSDVPLSENIIAKKTEGTKEQVLEDLYNIAVSNPEKVITRNYYRVYGNYAESAWNCYFGTFEEFKRQAGIILTRQQHQLEKHIAKHASVDHYRKLSIDRLDYADRYVRENTNRFKTAVVGSDFHDREIDKFFLRVFIDTCARIQPDKIILGGDIFDLPEFGKYSVDPREWDVVGRIEFVHKHILGPLRTVCPESDIDFIEGNHEARLLRHLGDATPALKAVLSDLHGFTISKLLALDKYQVNYIAKSDLAVYSKQDMEKEVGKNYKIYWDCFLVHHFPHARNMNLPGVNGHHHKHQVWSQFNPIYGAYEWHQLGSGHKRDASYCAGERWHNGFAVVNIDTATRATNFDYVPITDFAVSGGKFYYREPSEIYAQNIAILS